MENYVEKDGNPLIHNKIFVKNENGVETTQKFVYPRNETTPVLTEYIVRENISPFQEPVNSKGFVRNRYNYPTNSTGRSPAKSFSFSIRPYEAKMDNKRLKIHRSVPKNKSKNQRFSRRRMSK